MKIIIIDDNEDFRKNIEHLIKTKYNYHLLASFSSGDEFIKLHGKYNPDIVLMDIAMPGSDGYVTTKKLMWQNPNLKIIAITMFTEKAYLQKLIETGFKGCVFKTNLFSELQTAIEKVNKGEFYFPEDISM